MHKPSKYQEDIYKFITDSTGNAVVNAVAGSGKSTTLINSLKLIKPGQSVLFLAFNKAIVEELKLKVGKDVEADVKIMTLHALGASTVNRSLWAVETKADKYRAFVNSLFYHDAEGSLTEGIEDSQIKEYKSNIMSLIDLCRLNLVNTKEGAKELAAKHAMILRGQEIRIAFRAIKWGLQQEDQIDFTDMLFFPLIKKMALPVYDWVFIDECQDLNAAQRDLFLGCIKPDTGRFLAVGDPQQAIYGFAGADVSSFKILQDLPSTKSLPLSVCYRCDRSIIKLAQGIVPQIECRDDAPKGKVDYKATLSQIKDGDMILCRLTAPLVDVCLQYISSGVKAYIKGRDIGAGLINLIQSTNRADMEDVLDILDRELTRVAVRYAKDTQCSIGEARESEAYRRQEDRLQAVKILAGDIQRASSVCSRIKAIFSDHAQGICLSTIHRSKGLENDRVFILCPEQLYHERSMQVEWMAEQEANLVYVAYTRAKHHLGFIIDYAAG